MLRFVLPALLLSSCAPPAAQSDALQQDMIANPRKYVPPQAASSSPEFGAPGSPGTEAVDPFAAAPASAPSSVPRPSPRPADSTGYCPDANSIAVIGGPPAEMLTRIKRTCQPGDRIVIPNSAIGLIMMACDESRPTMQMGPQIACALRR